MATNTGASLFSDFAKRQAGGNIGPTEGTTWQGGIDWSNGLGKVIPAGYVYSNGQWVSPINAQANTLAQKKIGYETENLGLQNEISREQLGTQKIQNQIAGDVGGRLSELLRNPNSIENDPGYQFQFDQGLNAVNRTAAAKGMLGSGNRLYDLTNYGQGQAKSAYGDQISRLGSLLGSTSQNSFQQNQNNRNNQYQTQPAGSVTLSGRY